MPMTFREAIKSPLLHAAMVVAIVAIAWFVAGRWNAWTGAARYQRTDDAYVAGDVTPLSAKVSGYVRSVLVSDYQSVRAGDPIVEIEPKSGFYDYDAKYTDGLTTHICPAQIPEDISDAMMGYALKAHRVLGCKGASRSDFRWDDQKGVEGIFLLEINTQPGMTPLSLVPEQAKHAGISYDDLVDRIVREAL